MRVVWKYTLTPEAASFVQGGDPRVRHVGIDPLWKDEPDRLEANVPTVWVELEPEGDDSISLVFVGTGHSIPWGQDSRHVGSCITPGGLVWHVYDINPQPREFRG